MSLVSLLCVIFYIIRLASFLHVMDRFEAYGNAFFLDFTPVFHWQQVFQATMGLLGALAILKMAKVTA